MIKILMDGSETDYEFELIIALSGMDLVCEIT